LYTGSQAKLIQSNSFAVLGSNSALGLPISAWFLVAAFLLAGLVLAKSIFGRMVYAVGGNEEAARLAGIRVAFVRAGTFVLAGGLAALAGVIVASQVGTAQSTFGGTLALDSISIVIIGGSSLFGGQGAMWRTAVGLLILATINNIFQTHAWNPSIQLVLKGAILVGAVGVDAWVGRRRA
jgi:ribose transport system permease protein